jgi:hypothetical protein
LNEGDVKASAFAMPLTSPAFRPGPYHLVDREYLTVTYRTDPDALRAIIPARAPTTVTLAERAGMRRRSVIDGPFLRGLFAPAPQDKEPHQSVVQKSP